MALGEHFTHVGDTVLYYPRKHKSNSPSQELTDKFVEIMETCSPVLRFYREVANEMKKKKIAPLLKISL